MSTSPLARVVLGRTGLSVTTLCIGTSPIGNMPAVYGYAVESEQAIAMVEAVFDSPINVLDTSNGYGVDGISERRIGEAIRRRGGLPEGFILQTKVDPDPVTHDFSADRVRASYDESLKRLGVDRVPILALHDPEAMTQNGFAPGGALEAMVELRDSGAVDHLAVAAGSIPEIERYLATGEFDVVLNHNQYTLLDRGAERMFRAAHAEGVGVLNAAPYGGGMLATGPTAQPRYAYSPADAWVVDRATRMSEICSNAGIPLGAAALQFSVRAPFVHSTVVGVSAPARVAQTIELLATEIPDSVWAELESVDA